VTVALSGTGTLSATYMGEAGPSATTHLIFDVTGYFVPDDSGATYVSLTPARLLDTRNSGVPANAVAVIGNPAASDFTSTDQVIVRWADAAPAGSVSDVGAQPARVARVTAAAGEPATWLRTLAVGGDVYRFASRLPPERIAAIVGALGQQPGVAYVEPDWIEQADASPPNDPYWTTPAPGQWDLSEGTTPTTYGIDLLGAWDITLGAGVVVAVIDSGITAHPDLAGQTVAGYDFIADVPTANDGNGRDADPSDPGDWITVAEDAAGPFAGCGVSDSSWHGTHVSGTIAALTNNTIGIAGIAPSAKIQPVRVLGKCGAYTSDIADAIVWASGGTVSLVPANATPARVINMSLSGSGSCPTTYQAAIDGAVSRGTVVAVAAGNQGGDASGRKPANCAGVITVAATDRNGVRASFSNYGSVVEIAAPGVSLWSTLNAGTTVPGSPTYAQYNGTSMATPHVAGVAALMLAANPSLTPAQVVALMQATAHPFATGGCPLGCGSGIVDAAKAVAALPPTVTSVTPGNGPAAGGTTVTIAGTGFTGATAVRFGATAAASFTVSSGTQISAVSPAGTGTVHVTVTGPGGTSATSSADEFTYVAALAGATYVSLTPARLLDTRNGTGLSGTFSSGVARTFAVTGHGGVPAGAVAVTGNLTVTQQTSPGFVALTPAPTNTPTTSTLNFPLGDNRANGVTVALSGTGTLSATYMGEAGPSATTHLIFDVTGYFVP
jgi:serine protease